MKIEDRPLFPLPQSKIPGNPTVVFVPLAVPVAPAVELAGPDAEPFEEPPGADPGLLGPASDKIHDLIPHIVRHPDSGQSSPRLFFSAMCSAICSARTSSLVWIFLSRYSMRSCSACWLGRLLCWKAAGPFSKNSFCQRYNTVGCSPNSSHNDETGSLSNKCRLRMATFSSAV